MNKLVTTFKKAGFQLQKRSPEILVAAGVVGVVASAVLACKATIKAAAIIDKYKSDVAIVHDCEANQGIEEYTHKDAVTDLRVLHIQTGVNLAKLYLPAIGLGALSLGFVLKSTDILRKRNMALGAAYATITQGFKEYRGRVVERFGAEIDRELKYNLSAKKIDVVSTGEDGKEKKGKETVAVANGGINGHSDYARIFDRSSRAWENAEDYNLLFLRSQQNTANDMLQSNGYLYLNDVYDLLDIPRSAAGQVVGWLYRKDNPVGDNYVDFGLYDVYQTRDANGDTGYEKGILLDFNVDGYILDSMKEGRA